jgi:hypothetical protein
VDFIVEHRKIFHRKKTNKDFGAIFAHDNWQGPLYWPAPRSSKL